MAPRFVSVDENNGFFGKVKEWLDATYSTAASVLWANIPDKPTTFPPTIGSTSTTAVAGNDSRLTNARTPTAHSHGIADMPAGTTITVLKSGGVWPARPTTRTDIFVQWKGADPSPSIVTSGTGGMYDNVDSRLVTP